MTEEYEMGTAESDDDEEFEYLALPEMDEEFLDGDLIDGRIRRDVGRIPFSAVHHEPVAFESQLRQCFMQGQRIIVTITDVQHDSHGKLLNPWLYTVHLNHGDFEWTVYRRFKHFQALHDSLRLLRARIRLAVPTKIHRERRKSFARRKKSLPRFPRRPEALIGHDEIEERKTLLQEYLQMVLRCPQYRKHQETLKFLEVSHLSFVNGLGPKNKEGLVQKRSGGRRFNHNCCMCCNQLCLNCTAKWDNSELRSCVCCLYNRRWLLLKDTFVAYVRPLDGKVRDVLLMDVEFEALCGTSNTGLPHGLRISNLTRNLMVKCWTTHNALLWKQAITNVANETAADFTKENRYGSFAPPRENSFARWFQDGAGYFLAVAEALERAREEIFITDWWLSPEIYLKRPMHEGDRWRLDVILKRRADAGVKIFVMVFKEMEMALGLNSYYTKQALLKLHPTNIKVLRHPDGINFWSHHEKTVIIDQRIAFLGGIDLCYGRWDTPEHRLTDLGAVLLSPVTSEGNEVFFAENTPLQVPTSYIPPVTTQKPLGSTLSNLVVTKTDQTKARRSFSSPETEEETKRAAELTTPKSDQISGLIITESPSPRDNTNPLADFGKKLEVLNPMTIMGQVQQKMTDVTTGYQSSPPNLEEPGHEKAMRELGVELDFDQMVEEAVAENAAPDQNIDIENLKELMRETSYMSSNVSDVGDEEGMAEARENIPGKLQELEVARLNEVNVDPVSEQYEGKRKKSHDGEKHRFPFFTRRDSGDEDGKPFPMFGRRDSNEKLSKLYPMFGRRDSDESDGVFFTPMTSVRGSTGDLTGDADLHNKYHTPPASTFHSKHKRAVNGELDHHNAEFRDGGPNPAYESGSDSPKKSSLAIVRHENYVNKIRRGKMERQSRSDETEQSETESAGHKPSVTDCNGFNQSETESVQQSELDEIAMSTFQERRPPSSLPIVEKKGDHVMIIAGIKDTGVKNEAYLLTPTENTQHAAAVGKKPDIVVSHASVDQPDNEVNVKKPSKPNAFLAAVKEASKKQAASDGQRSSMSEQGEEMKRDTVSETSHTPSGTATPASSVGGRKRAKMSALAERMRRQKKDGDSASVAGSTHVTESTPPTPQMFNKIERVKPTTPPMKKKFALRARQVRADVKEKYRKRGSKSMDVDGEDGITNFYDLYGMYRKFNEMTIPDSDMGDGLDPEGANKLWIGKDYTNFIFKDFVELDKPFNDFIDRTVTPRMPWHDIGAVVYGKSARDVARHFIQRWNFTKHQKDRVLQPFRQKNLVDKISSVLLEKRKMNENYPMLLPKTYTRVTIPKRVLESSFPCNAQILRSSSSWSAGIEMPEHSIQNAYVDLILTAKHYIYIENQFFVTIGESNVIENRLGDALYQRIKRAHTHKEAFRVYVVMPLLPAFEGELGTNGGTAIQAVTHWNYSSICRGGKSLFERLKANGVIDPTEYISFYGLRRHDELNGKLVTELIYVHSKLMIVDDKSVIIGSANINDRSMLGTRDSEMAVLVQDTRFIPSTMNGQPYEAGWFASSLRTSLFREHLGLKKSSTDIDVNDPASLDFYKGVWLKTAAVNTNIYDKVFLCIPTDYVKNHQDLKVRQSRECIANTNPEIARSLLRKVQGSLVLLPLLFLCDVNLQPNVGTKEALAPTIIWT